ncbi:MAG: DUF997 family protein [Candidatus Aminicenantes bacterium]|nr:DUF997 family protein [Candidatus Aminicenantes bacterium]
MKWIEDPRVKVSRRAFLLAWVFFGVYMAAVMAASYLLGIDLLMWGLPRWVTVGNILLPAIFVILLIIVVEKLIPDVLLTDEENERKGPQ